MYGWDALCVCYRDVEVLRHSNMSCFRLPVCMVGMHCVCYRDVEVLRHSNMSCVSDSLYVWLGCTVCVTGMLRY